MIFTCFVFFLCCFFAFEAEKGNIKLILALPLLFPLLQTNTKPSRSKSVWLLACVWWRPFLYTSTQYKVRYPKLVENLNLDLRFFSSNHLPPKEILPNFPFYKLETHHVVNCTHMQQTNTSWLDCKFMKFLWGWYHVFNGNRDKWNKVVHL